MSASQACSSGPKLKGFGSDINLGMTARCAAILFILASNIAAISQKSPISKCISALTPSRRIHWIASITDLEVEPIGRLAAAIADPCDEFAGFYPGAYRFIQTLIMAV
jgi:hypothetical protein